MLTNQTVEILKSLSKTELKRFGEFLKSPYFNTDVYKRQVLTTTLGFAETGAVPRGRLAHQLKRRFHREGWSFRAVSYTHLDVYKRQLDALRGAQRYFKVEVDR